VAGYLKLVAGSPEARPAVLQAGRIVRKVSRHPLELLDHRRDHGLQESGDETERHKDDHHDGNPPPDAPPGQPAHGGVEADRQEQGDQHADEHVASGIDGGRRGRSGNGTEAPVKALTEKHHRPYAVTLLIRMEALRNLIFHEPPPNS
jgi:hypothetical protein